MVPLAAVGNEELIGRAELSADQLCFPRSIDEIELMQRSRLLIVSALIIKQKDANVAIDFNWRDASAREEEDLSGDAASRLVIDADSFGRLPHAQNSYGRIARRGLGKLLAMRPLG